jgi:hypothetical protein
MVEWRRNKVQELLVQGYSQWDIADNLRVDQSTISRDIDYLRSQSRQKIRRYIDETLPNEYEKCLVGITSILKEAWTTSQNTEDKREKIHALSLAKECYSMKLDLLTNATVVNDAMRFVSSNNNNKSVSREEDNSSSQESKEPDYNDKQDSSDKRHEEKQENQTEEILTETINQVF